MEADLAVKNTIAKIRQQQLANKEVENNCIKDGQLVLWPESERRMPNELIRSSLFSAKSKKATREHFTDSKLFVWGSAQLRYTGEEIRAYDDELVWLQLCHYFRKVDVIANESVEFTTSQLLKDLNWAKNKQYYQRVEDCLNRLDSGSVKVRTKRGGLWKEYTFSLIRKFKRVGEGSKAKWKVYLEPEALSMYDGSYYTKFPWDIFLKSSPTEKRILGWILSHKDPLPIEIDELRALLSSSNTNNASFKQSVNVAIKNLVKNKMIEGAEWMKSMAGGKNIILLKVNRNTK